MLACLGDQFQIKTSTKIITAQPGSTGKPSTIVLLSFGGISGFCGQSLSYPLDIVRRRMQTDVITKQNYDSIIGTLKSIYK